jgi:four helix bundle protein
MSQTKSFKDLIVWQKAKALAIMIYKITDDFPKSEQFGLSSQMRRSAVSISSNIAEGYRRFHAKEKRQFTSTAFGSGAELESQLEIAKEIYRECSYQEAEDLLADIMKILNSFLSKS